MLYRKIQNDLQVLGRRNLHFNLRFRKEISGSCFEVSMMPLKQVSSTFFQSKAAFTRAKRIQQT